MGSRKTDTQGKKQKQAKLAFNMLNVGVWIFDTILTKYNHAAEQQCFLSQ